jgi:hypothetical protein
MAQVISMHELQLNPGVDEAEFERFVRDEALPVLRLPPGMHGRLARGDRGQRAGHYLLLVEFDSVEARARLYPAPATMSTEMQQAFAAAAPLFQKWATFGPPPSPDNPRYTDYVLVAG